MYIHHQTEFANISIHLSDFIALVRRLFCTVSGLLRSLDDMPILLVVLAAHSTNVVLRFSIVARLGGVISLSCRVVVLDVVCVSL